MIGRLPADAGAQGQGCLASASLRAVQSPGRTQTSDRKTRESSGDTRTWALRRDCGHRAPSDGALGATRFPGGPNLMGHRHGDGKAISMTPMGISRGFGGFHSRQGCPPYLDVSVEGRLGAQWTKNPIPQKPDRVLNRCRETFWPSGAPPSHRAIADGPWGRATWFKPQNGLRADMLIHPFWGGAAQRRIKNPPSPHQVFEEGRTVNHPREHGCPSSGCVPRAPTSLADTLAWASCARYGQGWRKMAGGRLTACVWFKKRHHAAQRPVVALPRTLCGRCRG